MCYKKTNTQRARPASDPAAAAGPVLNGSIRVAMRSEAVLLYKEVVSLHIDLGRFTSAAKVQKEIAELYEADCDVANASEAYQTAADYYQAEESNSTANQMLLKVGESAASALCDRRPCANAPHHTTAELRTL